MKSSIFWFRRDLRLEDNTALYFALSQKENVLPIFIFDENILEELPIDDPRVQFIYKSLEQINQQLQKNQSSLLILKGKPEEIWTELIKEHHIDSVYINKDYEPYGIKRDEKIEKLLSKNNIGLFRFKDQVIHEESKVMKADGTPYTVFTPYKNKWLSIYKPQGVKSKISFKNFHQKKYPFPSIQELGFVKSNIVVKEYKINDLSNYEIARNFPGLDATSYLGPHLRFGTVSIRQVIAQLKKSDHIFLSELIWREFFMQILFHFPKVISQNFRPKYDGIKWLNNTVDFKIWCEGKTGYPLVDAGMRQLNQTGYMHNRVRMITAGFLCKHLLIDWRRGEAYFAEKLLDYELSSNNGNWQWSAGTGCDAAPYFRIFNPIAQLEKFDKTRVYVSKWIPELATDAYPAPIIEHKFARLRALEKYRNGISESVL